MLRVKLPQHNVMIHACSTYSPRTMDGRCPRKQPETTGKVHSASSSSAPSQHIRAPRPERRVSRAARRNPPPYRPGRINRIDPRLCRCSRAFISVSLQTECIPEHNAICSGEGRTAGSAAVLFFVFLFSQVDLPLI